MHRDGAAGLEDILHGVAAAQTAAQGQIVAVQLRRVLGHHLGAGAGDQDADGVQRGGGGGQRDAHEDGRRQGGHGREAHQPVIPHRRGKAHQHRRMAKGAAASDKAGAQEFVIHLFLVGDHRVPCPCHPVAHGVDAAAHKARKTVRGVVDGLAHGNGGQPGAAVHRGDAPACCFDSFHSTSQYGRPARFLNRAAA